MQIDYRDYILPVNKDLDFVLKNTKQKFIQDIVCITKIETLNFNVSYHYHIIFNQICYN